MSLIKRVFLVLIIVFQGLIVHAGIDYRGVFGVFITEDSEDLSLNGQSKIVGSITHNASPETLSGVQVDVMDRPSKDSARLAKVLYSTYSDDSGRFEILLPPGVYDVISNGFGMVYLSQERQDSVVIKANYIYNAYVSHSKNEDQMIYFKPVIYLYSKKEINASLKLNFGGQFIHTYPEYQNGWEVTVKGNGKLESAGKSYDYLFWDGEFEPVASLNDMQSGSLVEKNNLTNFLESSLTQMGLNDKETQDFIAFWGPKLSKYDSSLIHFSTERYDEKVPLSISPKPSNLFRVFMVFADGSKINFKPEKQTFEQVSREGFTVIEWGGGELNLPNL